MQTLFEPTPTLDMFVHSDIFNTKHVKGFLYVGQLLLDFI